MNPYISLNIQFFIRKYGSTRKIYIKNWPQLTFWSPNVTFKDKWHFGHRAILKAWTIIVILSSMAASFEQEIPSKFNRFHSRLNHVPPIVLSWYSWNWPLTNRSTRLDFPTADSPSRTSLNWHIFVWPPAGLWLAASEAMILRKMINTASLSVTLHERTHWQP